MQQIAGIFPLNGDTLVHLGHVGKVVDIRIWCKFPINVPMNQSKHYWDQYMPISLQYRLIALTTDPPCNIQLQTSFFKAKDRFACLDDIYRESFCIWVTLVSPIVCIPESYKDRQERISRRSRNQLYCTVSLHWRTCTTFHSIACYTCTTFFLRSPAWVGPWASF